MHKIIGRSKEEKYDQKAYCKYSGFNSVPEKPQSDEKKYQCQHEIIMQVFSNKRNWNESKIIIICVKNEENGKENNIPGEGE